MHSRNEVRASLGLLLLAASASSLAASCGGGSDSEVEAKGGETSTSAGTTAKGGEEASAGSSKGGSSSTSGSGNTEAGTKATGGNSGGGSGPGETCEAKDSWTESVHYVLDVTWEGTTAAESGTGKINIWSRVTFKVNGDKLDVGLHACGSVLPETKLNGIGQIAAGGDKVLIEVQEGVWDAESIPVTMATGKQSGIDVGSDVEFTYVSLLGATMPDPAGAWPKAGADMTAVDLEGDGSKGYTATPRKGGGYVLPPTGLGLGGSAPSADKVYLVSRQAMTLKGKRTACDAHSGTAMVASFDNHVVGCHISGGAECSADQADFVDSNRMQYKAKSATYEAKVVDDDATCADVRAALPQ
jgi:hypothetical protein